MSTALAGRLEDPVLLKRLIDQGADINKGAGVTGLSTPMREACQFGRLATIKWLR